MYISALHRTDINYDTCEIDDDFLPGAVIKVLNPSPGMYMYLRNEYCVSTYIVVTVCNTPLIVHGQHSKQNLQVC